MYTGKEIKVTHIMADGTVYDNIEDVKKHIAGKPLPEMAQRLILDFIRSGAEQRAAEQRAAEQRAAERNKEGG